jgi:hypothetical protein
MKVIDKMGAQGDVMFIRVESLPVGLTPAEKKDGRYVVAHSETQHDHVVDSRNAELLIDRTNDFIAYLQVRGEGVEVKHLRSFDTHESLFLPKGNYQVRRQREYVPEGYRRAAD